MNKLLKTSQYLFVISNILFACTNKNITANLEGTQTGEISADVNTGMLINEKLNTEIEGAIHVADKIVPVTISVIKKVKLEKL